MKRQLRRILAAATLLAISCSTGLGQTSTNHGLVGVGRIPSTSFDQLGPNLDTLGGIGSAIWLDPLSLTRSGDEAGGFTYAGVLYSAQDRGFGDGAQDFHPRLQSFQVQITPYYGAAPAPQTQIALSNTATMLLTYDLTNTFTGFDAGSLTSVNFPSSEANSPGKGHRSLDPEGLTRALDGGWYIADEYGPFIYKFSAGGNLDYAMRPPAAFLPKRGPYPAANAFTATNLPTSGRRNNRGFEGVSLTPDGRRLLTVLQSPLVQDGGAGNLARADRLVVFDVDPASASYQQPIAEYIYPLSLNGSATTNRNTPLSEILALNSVQFLVIERDNLGLGSGTNTVPSFKRVMIGDLSVATNIINTGYDLEAGAPGQISFAPGSLPPGVAPVSRVDLVNLLDPGELARFGLNLSTNQDLNTLNEKWEGLALLPLV
ncbi:MAG: esterase-like activity of phytase family protein [Verrucomicrobia bacterium]|nr:esterase-like activity of phytase family protein [Verrucomicrobiota bacterium]MBI3869558.1 esterase-like activity of phytase family protein [Verrucomicrobiota bacterium]